MKYYVYIVTNPNKTVFYTGQTSNLYRRIREHYENRGKKETFAGRYYCYNLVHFEEFSALSASIHRENEIKHLLRAKKLELIAQSNPNLFFMNNAEFGSDWKTVPLKDEHIQND